MYIRFLKLLRRKNLTVNFRHQFYKKYISLFIKKKIIKNGFKK